jgi:hypothetical protein
MSSTNEIKKNQSFNSTNHVTCNQSHATNFYSGNKIADSLIVNYADIPMEKITPRWNQSASTWRHTSHKYSFAKN